MNKHQKVDIILSSNYVFTGLKDHPESACIAITDNKIVFIGSRQEAEPFMCTETKFYDLDNKLILPGFHDFHMHIPLGMIALESINLSEARSEEQAAEMVWQFAETKPNARWIIGFNWDTARWVNKKLPHLNSLDVLLPNRPVILFHSEGHYIWVNSKALSIVNIDRETVAPSYGIIDKDESGRPTGILYEKATGHIIKEAFQFSRAERKRMFRGFLQHAARLGVTSVNSLFDGSDELQEDYDLYKEVEEEGDLSIRIHLAPPLNGDLDQAQYLREKYRSDKVQFSGLKQFIDGVITSRTAYLIEPYYDQKDLHGGTVFSEDTITNWVVDADRMGFRIRFHAIGDGAIRIALNVFEEAQKQNGARDSRHTIEHVEVIHPDDMVRFQTLGVIASMQPDHLAASNREEYSSRVGAEREPYVFAINSLMKQGAKVAFGTDFPIVSLNPLFQIYRAVSRVDHSGNPEHVWNSAERISLVDAIRAYTQTPSYGTFREDELGTLEIGKLADITVLDRNILEGPVEQLLETKVLLTISDGRVVYEDAYEILKTKSHEIGFQPS